MHKTGNFNVNQYPDVGHRKNGAYLIDNQAVFHQYQARNYCEQQATCLYTVRPFPSFR